METGRRKFALFLLGSFPLLWQVSNARAGTQEDQGKDPTSLYPPAPDPSHREMAAVLKQNHEKIKKDAQRLYELASDLKKQIENTDSSQMLSLNLVKHAEEAEKLAKQIRTLAIG